MSSKSNSKSNSKSDGKSSTKAGNPSQGSAQPQKSAPDPKQDDKSKWSGKGPDKDDDKGKSSGKGHDKDDDKGKSSGKGYDKDDDKGKGSWFGQKDGKDNDKDDDKDDDKGDWKDGWYHGGTKDKVAGQTGAAKDDVFSVANAGTIVLDVLDNDPGSSALWSIDQNALAGNDCERVERDLDTVTLPSGATLSVNADGTLTYTPPASISELPEGETFTDSFLYVIRMAKGALSSAQANITINGTYVESNSPATFSGDLSGSLDEDGLTNTVTGTLQVSDPDAGEAAFDGTGPLQGNYGLFSFDLDSGSWSYLLDNNNSLVQALNNGQSLTDSLEVLSVDGSTATINVTINGADEPSGPTAERWLLTRTGMERETDGEQPGVIPTSGLDRILMIGAELVFGDTGPAIVTQPDGPRFGDEDKIAYFDMTRLPAVTVSDFDGDGLADDTTLSFQYSETVGGIATVSNVLVVLIDFVGFDPARHVQGPLSGGDPL